MIKKLLDKEIIGVIYITSLTILALVWGFSLIPSPQSEKSFVYDHKRIIDLGQINDTISDYDQNNGTLPQTLNQLTYNADDSTSPLNKVDPQTNASYGYIVTDSTDYKLCATFSTNSSNDDMSAYDDASGDYANFISQFAHPAGYYCFSENVSGNSPSVSPTTYCIGDDCQISPSPTVFPVRPPCGVYEPGNSNNSACPMIKLNTSPAVYNSNANNSPAGGAN